MNKDLLMNKEEFIRTVRSLRHLVGNYRPGQFALAYPKAYVAVVTAAALAGYAFLLLFPSLSVAALLKLVAVAQAVPFTLDSFSQGLVWFSVFVFGVAMSHHILTIEFALPKGVGLWVSQAPELLARIETPREAGLWRNFFWPKFSNVLLSEKFELEIRKTPVSGVPVWSKNTLVIGLPVMQTMSEHYFVSLSRRLFPA